VFEISVLRRMYGPDIEDIKDVENYIMIRCIINRLPFTKYYYVDKLKEGDVGNICITNERREIYIAFT
jgi:hypothetical protein